MNIRIFSEHPRQLTFRDLDTGKETVLFVKNETQRIVRISPDGLGLKTIIKKVCEQHPHWNHLADLVFPCYDAFSESDMTSFSFDASFLGQSIEVWVPREQTLRFAIPIDGYDYPFDVYIGDPAPWISEHSTVNTLLKDPNWNIFLWYLLQHYAPAPDHEQHVACTFRTCVTVSELLTLAALRSFTSPSALSSIHTSMISTHEEVGLHL